MKRPDIEAMEARVNAATEGPWAVSSHDGRRNCSIDSLSEVKSPDGKDIATVWDRGKKENRYFIAHARADVTELLAYIKHLEGKESK